MEPKLNVSYYASFIDSEQADRVFAILMRELDWQHRSIKIMGRMVPQPRLTAWYGDADARYTYSGLSWQPLVWHPALLDIKQEIESRTGQVYNSVLCNLYRDGNDSMGLHADDEPELGIDPVIASVSLGVTRIFRMRPKANTQQKTDYHLSHGSLLVMGKGTQSEWKHEIPKQKKVIEPRINLTYRLIIP